MSDNEKMLDLNVPPEELPVGRMEQPVRIEVNVSEARVLELAYRKNPDLSVQMEHLKTNLHGLSAQPLSENEITFFWNKRKALSEKQITSLLSEKRKALDKGKQMASGSGSVSWPHTPSHNHTGRPFHQLPNMPIPRISPKTSNTDDTLLSLIEYQLGYAEEKWHKVAEAAAGKFPFKIEDNVGDNYVTLSREYEDEEIIVKIHQEKEEEKDQEDEKQHIYLDVSVSKKSGRVLKFFVKAEREDGIRIQYFGFKNQSDDDYKIAEPNFSDLDRTLKIAFHKYLEVRGFELSNTKFLCDYMGQRKYMKSCTLLKALKNFIGK